MPMTCTADIVGLAPYSPSRAHEAPKLPKETPGDYDERTWRHKMHTDANGIVLIPGMAFKMAVDTAARMLGDKIPGKRNATYSKFFLSGCLVFDDVSLGIKADDVQAIRIHANADGVRDSGKRVWRIFPEIPAGWTASVTFFIAADEITREVFERTLSQAGTFCGVGRFRASKGGKNGRFVVKRTRWE